MGSEASPPQDIVRAVLVIVCVGVMAWFGLRLITRDLRFRSGLLALTVAATAGIHLGLAPDHYEEMPRLGISFVIAAIVGAPIAVGLIWRPAEARLVAAAGVFCLGEIVIWLLFVMGPVPFFPGTPESVKTDAIISKAIEAVGVVLAAALLAQTVLGPEGAWRVSLRRRLAELRPPERPVETGLVPSPPPRGEPVPAVLQTSAGRRFREQVDEAFSSGRDVGQVLEEVARLGVAAILQNAIETQVTEMLDTERHSPPVPAVAEVHRNGATPS